MRQMHEWRTDVTEDEASDRNKVEEPQNMQLLLSAEPICPPPPPPLSFTHISIRAVSQRYWVVMCVCGQVEHH